MNWYAVCFGKDFCNALSVLLFASAVFMSGMQLLGSSARAGDYATKTAACAVLKANCGPDTNCPEGQTCPDFPNCECK